MDADSFAKWVPVAIQFAKCFQGGTNTDDVRSIIKEEMNKSENQQNNETMKQMLTMIEQKHAAELHEASRERDMFKVQAELLANQLQDLQKSKRTEDKNERMRALLKSFAQLNTNEHPNLSTNDRKNYQRRPNTKKFPQKGNQNNNESNLPWMDSPKSFPNGQLGGKPDKPFNQENKGQYQKNFNYSDTKFGGNIDKPLNQEKKNHYQKNFQQGYQSSHDSLKTPRGHESKRGAGRGQRGSNNRGRGRSASVGRNMYESQVGNPSCLNNDIQSTASYHVQVTKNVGNQWQWVGSEQHPNAPHSANRGRGSTRGGQRGSTRGGRGSSHFQSQGNQRPTVNKNRKKKTNEEDGDPEDNCTLS